MKYRTELHCHSKEGSACAHESSDGIAKKYLEHGYTTIVLTNHLKPFEGMDDPEKWAEAIDIHYAAYEKLKAAADGKLNILMALEFRFTENDNDYLVYGFDRDFLINHGSRMLRMGVGDFVKMTRDEGILTVHAHPFRLGATVMHPDKVDAIEVYNADDGEINNNDLAEAWAKTYGKIMTSGTDHHNHGNLPRGGILTDEPIRDIKQLVEIIKGGNYELIRG